MNFAEISIKRPVFITAIVVMILVVGLLALSKLPVDLFPNVTFPVVVVTVPYKGSGPAEVETLIAKPLEDELSTVSGIKRLSSISQEGVGTVIAEFTLETDVKYAEQQVRDRLTSAKRVLPKEIDEPTIRRIDPADQPVLIVSLTADLKESELFDLADQTLKARLEQVNQVGLVNIFGGRKREIQVQLDRKKLKSREISAGLVSTRISSAGENVPVGKVNDQKSKEVVFRTISEFKKIEDVKSVVLNFYGNDIPVTVANVGQVVDTLEDETSRTFANGQKSLFIYAYRQSGANTVAVVDALKKRIDQLNTELQKAPGKPHLTIVRDGATWIRANIEDVKESIFFGIILAVIVVFFFLANGRSTAITSLALPNSLIGAFILMSIAGFSVNIMTLLALSLTVGLLIDDAIVVRENIFRHIEMGKKPIVAALVGTNEVRLAVIATSLTVIAVFAPVGFLKGVTGQFFREFGLTICFAMLISLFDALTIAPMLSAYFAGKSEHLGTSKNIFIRIIDVPLIWFGKFQDLLEHGYERILKFTVRRPIIVLLCSIVVFVISMQSVKYVPKTFLPTQDAGEFSLGIDLPPGSSLDKMAELSLEIDKVLHSNREVEITALTVGGSGAQPESNVAEFYVKLIPAKERSMNTSQVKEVIRGQLKKYAYANPNVKDYDAVGGGQRPFTMNLVGSDIDQLEKYALTLLTRLKQYQGLKDVDINFRPGKPEFQVVLDKSKSQTLGISTIAMGQELRAQVEGVEAAKFRENGREYNIRVRLQDDQRNLRDGFDQTYVPNINQSLVPLSYVASKNEASGPSKITRQDRARYVQISGDITPGAGLGDIIKDVTEITEKEIPIPAGVRYAFIGQAENLAELVESIVIAMGLGIIFIYFVLASLYESFVTPITIMIALPLAICGSFVALLIFKQSLNIFSMIGILMLLGIATKNSILLVDYANQLIQQGYSLNDAIVKAGKTRLRPILMTTMALIAGMLPVAIGLNEASRQRTSMGIGIIGGLISSTLLTLIVVPATFSFIERFRVWSLGWMKRIFMSQDVLDESNADEAKKTKASTHENGVEEASV